MKTFLFEIIKNIKNYKNILCKYGFFVANKYISAILQFCVVWFLGVKDKSILADFGVYKVFVAYLPFMLLGQATIYTVEVAKKFNKERFLANAFLMLILSLFIVPLFALCLSQTAWSFEPWMAFAFVGAVVKTTCLLLLADARIVRNLRFLNLYFLVPPVVQLLTLAFGIISIEVLIIIDIVVVSAVSFDFLLKEKYPLKFSFTSVKSAAKSIVQRLDLALFLIVHYGVLNLYKLSQRNRLDDSEYASLTFFSTAIEGCFLASTSIGFLLFTDFIRDNMNNEKVRLKRRLYELLIIVSALGISCLLIFFFNDVSRECIEYFVYYTFMLLLFYKETFLQKHKNKLLFPSILLGIGLLITLFNFNANTITGSLFIYYCSLIWLSRDYDFEDALILTFAFIPNEGILFLILIIAIVKVRRVKKCYYKYE